MNKLILCTLNWNGKDKLEKLYPSLMSSLHDINYSWIIKDNASKDDSIAYLNSLNNPNVKVIAYHNNMQNFSEGMNFCFNEATPDDEDLILLLNNDVVFNDKKSIKNMINLIKKDDDIGVVGARLMFPNNKIQHAGVIFDDNHKMPMHFRAHENFDNNAEKNREFQAVTGAVLLTKAKYYKQICTNKDGTKGLDHAFIWAFDDVDMCLSIKYNLNKKIVYCGETNIMHEESASLKKNPVNKLFMNQNTNTFKNKWSSKIVLDKNSYKDPFYKIYRKD